MNKKYNKTILTLLIISCFLANIFPVIAYNLMTEKNGESLSSPCECTLPQVFFTNSNKEPVKLSTRENIFFLKKPSLNSAKIVADDFFYEKSAALYNSYRITSPSGNTYLLL